MTIADFVFYVFAITCVSAGLFVTLAKNPVHSGLWLILTFLTAAGMCVLLGAEFVAMLLIIVYVGAVMVLFLFVVMMLDIDFTELKAEMAKYLPLGMLIGIVLLMQLGMLFGEWAFSPEALAQRGAVAPELSEAHNTEALGLLIYDKYIYLFQLAGMILLVAMIGAIVLTLRHRVDIKRQDVLAQMHRDPATAMELKDVKPGQGL